MRQGGLVRLSPEKRIQRARAKLAAAGADPAASPGLSKAAQALAKGAEAAANTLIDVMQNARSKSLRMQAATLVLKMGLEYRAVGGEADDEGMTDEEQLEIARRTVRVLEHKLAVPALPAPEPPDSGATIIEAEAEIREG